MLPTSRDLNSILLMAPGVHPTGPAGAFSFGGSVTFENLFLLNGVSINENIRGQAFDTAIEDAIRKRPSPTAASLPSSGGSVAAWSTSSRSRAATASLGAFAIRSTTTNGARWRHSGPSGWQRRPSPALTRSCRPTSTRSAARSRAIGCGSSRRAGCATSRRAGR